MFVDVLHSNRYIEIGERVPLENGDLLRVTSEIPAGYHATLFLVSSEGEVRELHCAAAKKNANSRFRFPAEARTASPLTGPRGTEILVLCFCRKSAITCDSFEESCGAVGRLPSLPPMSLLTADLNGVYSSQTTRELGPPESVSAPENTVKDYLDNLRKSLSGEVAFLQAVAFYHGE